VRALLGFSAVGSLREDISPGTFALPTQIIDRTKGVRPVSFFEGTTVVAHAAFGDPFSRRLVKWLEGPITHALADEGRGVKLVTEKCIVCMEGPQFSTRAESLMYRQWGGDLINMSVLPEAKLAREAEIRYSALGFSTLLLQRIADSGRDHDNHAAMPSSRL
jgi:5'-methylthioadenosine phosphorylase